MSREDDEAIADYFRMAGWNINEVTKQRRSQYLSFTPLTEHDRQALSTSPGGTDEEDTRT